MRPSRARDVEGPSLVGVRHGFRQEWGQAVADSSRSAVLLASKRAQGQECVLSQEKQQTCSPDCRRCASLPVAQEMLLQNKQSQ